MQLKRNYELFIYSIRSDKQKIFFFTKQEDVTHRNA